MCPVWYGVKGHLSNDEFVGISVEEVVDFTEARPQDLLHL
jgi:hypothetical protein